MQETPARTPLQEILHNISTNEQVAAALGLANLSEHDEEFLQGQRRAARRRFLALCLSATKLPPHLELSDLDSADLAEVECTARELFEGIVPDYKAVRTWWLQRGQAEYNSAVHRQREQKRLAKARLSVLVVLAAGGAKYLAYGPSLLDVRLVDKVEDAYAFRPTVMSELDPAVLRERARDFDALLAPFEAKEIKVLARFVD